MYIDCGEPVEDAGAIIEYTTTKAYSTAHYQCRRPPPLHSGIDDISCELSGQWTSRSIFKCPSKLFRRLDQWTSRSIFKCPSKLFRRSGQWTSRFIFKCPSKLFR